MTLELPGYLLLVDGQELAVEGAEATESLLHVLRERLGVPTVNAGCALECTGGCAVLIDGELRHACLTLAAAASGRSVVTAAGIGRGAAGHVAEAMAHAGAVQCGTCVPSAVLAAHALLEVDSDPSDAAIREALSGVVCRCGGYGRLMAGVRAAARAGSPSAQGAARAATGEGRAGSPSAQGAARAQPQAGDAG
ncbi:MAG: (2Fe-2S)-binding protein [Sporichthyaceae bacterium]